MRTAGCFKNALTGKAMEVFALSAQRDQEAELAYVGNLYREAIRNYYLSAPDGRHSYPGQFDDLMKDSRHLVTRRYLRRLYVDPITSQSFRPLIAPQGGIWGVASGSSKLPVRLTPPPGVVTNGGAARSYRDWQFVFDGSD